MTRILFFSLVAAALVGGVPSYGADPDFAPPKCPEGSTPVVKGAWWACQKKKELVRGPKKNPHDPCPDGMWWHLSFEPCTPVLCTEIPNDKPLDFSCPVHHHQHRSAIPAGDTQARPISCVQAYSPENLETGGQPRRAGECGLCTDSRHAETRFGPLGSGSKPALQSSPAKGSANGGDCPSGIFAHNPGNGIRAFSCVATCPAGTHPSEPGDFPYQGAKACIK